MNGSNLYYHILRDGKAVPVQLEDMTRREREFIFARCAPNGLCMMVNALCAVIAEDRESRRRLDPVSCTQVVHLRPAPADHSEDPEPMDRRAAIGHEA